MSRATRNFIYRPRPFYQREPSDRQLLLGLLLALVFLGWCVSEAIGQGVL